MIADETSDTNQHPPRSGRAAGSRRARRATELLSAAPVARAMGHRSHATNRIYTGDRWFPVGDFPGTLGVRRTFFLDIDAYDGDMLFENLQLMRTVRAAGGKVDTALDLYVRRLPPSARQLVPRVRQAYDDFAIPLRMGGFLSIGPVVGLAWGTNSCRGGTRDRRHHSRGEWSASRRWSLRLSGQWLSDGSCVDR